MFHHGCNHIAPRGATKETAAFWTTMAWKWSPMVLKNHSGYCASSSWGERNDHIKSARWFCTRMMCAALLEWCLWDHATAECSQLKAAAMFPDHVCALQIVRQFWFPSTVSEFPYYNMKASSGFFHQGISVGVLFYAVLCWGRELLRMTNRINELIRKAGSVIGLHPDPLEVTIEKRARFVWRRSSFRVPPTTTRKVFFYSSSNSIFEWKLNFEWVLQIIWWQ